MKAIVLCLLLVALVHGQVVTDIELSTGGGRYPNLADLPLPARTAVSPIDDTPGLTGELLITVHGTDLNAGPGRLRVLSDSCPMSPAVCQTCPDFVDNPVALTLVDPAGTFVRFTLKSTVATPENPFRSPQNAFGARMHLSEGGIICFGVGPGDDTLAPTNVIYQLAWDCNENNVQCPVPLATANGWVRHINPLELAENLESRTTACTDGAGLCHCFNPSAGLLGCCDGMVYNTAEFKCCPNNNFLVPLESPCPCVRTGEVAVTGTNSGCPASEPFCCLPEKFTELGDDSDIGECFNRSIHRCCNTGFRYNPGSDQCCSINGIQTLNVPCPCEQDSHCVGGQIGSGALKGSESNTDFVCCKQTSPGPLETPHCSLYSNFPTGTGPYYTQKCSGSCIDLRYQFCCNGATCLTEYESCCNATCCNRFSGSCANIVYRPGAPGSQSNWLSFVYDNSDVNSTRTVFKQCTTIEVMNPYRAFWVFILPTSLLAIALFGLALVLVYANKAAARQFTFIERALVAVSVILVLLTVPLYFAPLYKYGVVICLVCFWTILAAATRERWLNIISVVGLGVLLLYLIDPFHGSAYFNLAYFRVHDPLYQGVVVPSNGTFEFSFGMTEFRSMGILHTTNMLWSDVLTVNQEQFCTNYFDYFRLDPALADFRFENPLKTTFGYCSRGYVLLLFIFEGFIIVLSLFLFFLALLGLILRFRKDRLEPVELEIRASDEFGNFVEY